LGVGLWGGCDQQVRMENSLLSARDGKPGQKVKKKREGHWEGRRRPRELLGGDDRGINRGDWSRGDRLKRGNFNL